MSDYQENIFQNSVDFSKFFHAVRLLIKAKSTNSQEVAEILFPLYRIISARKGVDSERLNANSLSV